MPPRRLLRLLTRSESRISAALTGLEMTERSETQGFTLGFVPWPFQGQEVSVICGGRCPPYVIFGGGRSSWPQAPDPTIRTTATIVDTRRVRSGIIFVSDCCLLDPAQISISHACALRLGHATSPSTSIVDTLRVSHFRRPYRARDDGAIRDPGFHPGLCSVALSGPGGVSNLWWAVPTLRDFRWWAVPSTNQH